MTTPKSERIPPRNDKFQIGERKSPRELRQEKCPHDHWCVQCSHCMKVLGSEVTHSALPPEHPNDILI